MKPNSCLYRATKEVCALQFNIDITSTLPVFDEYNTGSGVPFENVVDCLNEALAQWGIQVSGVHGNIVGEFKHRGLCQGTGFVPAPNISFIAAQQHAIANLGGPVLFCQCVFTLR